jgi:hypothetical protein
MKISTHYIVPFFLCALFPSVCLAQHGTLPPRKPLAMPEKVVAEHIAALNACDWNRMMAQYDDDVEFLSKDGGIVKGRAAIGEMFHKALKPPSEGGPVRDETHCRTYGCSGQYGQRCVACRSAFPIRVSGGHGSFDQPNCYFLGGQLC